MKVKTGTAQEPNLDQDDGGGETAVASSREIFDRKMAQK